MQILRFPGWPVSKKIETSPIYCVFFVDSKLEVTHSIASVGESASKFQLLSGLDGALVVIT